MRKLLLAGLSLALLLVLVQAGAGATKPHADAQKQTAKPISTLAMDGARVAYMLSGRRVGVWNVATGASSTIKGTYPGNGRNFGSGTGEVAIAGTRVALITRFVIGNTLQTQERLYTASLGGSARQLGKLTNHSSSPGDSTVPGSGYADGSWLGGLVGSGKVLAVSSWKANDAATSAERLSLIAPTGLRTIVSGPGTIVAQSAAGGHIAVLRSTDAWPAYQGPAAQTSPLVGVYSAGGALLGEVAPDPGTFVRIALSGNQLVTLRLDVPQAGSLTATVDVYDWTTGALLHTWPLALPHGSPGLDRLAVAGRVAVIQGSFRLRLLDLTTGKTATVSASRPYSPAAIGSRGLVYGVNSGGRQPHGRLVFVPMAKLLATVTR